MEVTAHDDILARRKSRQNNAYEEVVLHAIEEMAELSFELAKFRRLMQRRPGKKAAKVCERIAVETGHALCQLHILSHLFPGEVVEKNFKKKLRKKVGGLTKTEESFNMWKLLNEGEKSTDETV